MSELKAVGPQPTKTPKVFVFDVRTLAELFRKKQWKSPFDNREFDKATVKQVSRRICYLTQRGYLQPPKPTQPSHTAAEAAVAEEAVGYNRRVRSSACCAASRATGRGCGGSGRLRGDHLGLGALPVCTPLAKV